MYVWMCVMFKNVCLCDVLTCMLYVCTVWTCIFMYDVLACIYVVLIIYVALACMYVLFEYAWYFDMYV